MRFGSIILGHCVLMSLDSRIIRRREVTGRTGPIGRGSVTGNVGTSVMGDLQSRVA